MKYEIEKSLWHVCRICNVKIQELAKIYGGDGVYYNAVFRKHLEIDHNITVEDYFSDITPVCPCGICNKKCKINKKKSSNFKFAMACGLNDGVKLWSEQAKISRAGSGNPMFNKIPWNNGLNKNNNAAIKHMSDNRKGSKSSIETRAKQSIAAKNRIVSPRLGCRHTEESKQLMRDATLRRIRDGLITHTLTKPHQVVIDILNKNGVRFEIEKLVEYWSFDIYIPSVNLYLEIDGDYWHSNPVKYKNGPQSKAQKINYTRDISKNKYCKSHDINLVRIWEYDIINNTKEVECTLRKLCQLEKLD